MARIQIGSRQEYGPGPRGLPAAIWPDDGADHRRFTHVLVRAHSGVPGTSPKILTARIVIAMRYRARHPVMNTHPGDDAMAQAVERTVPADADLVWASLARRARPPRDTAPAPQ